ncbi:MmcB family DNA repair protein [Gluconacetobacter tumulisoli]|uniref:MmcB family DNA repair protein n=1 Tax=Gluconacetobacter tumulisoli TaxID=1286189 RepID=A0A7W4K9S2_9PROT|nr:MmcB family DNA repair protein [Gluconacetobacter tumulisoli]MBB2202977.1 MmcB family DNA repair protein [Gluconacetobacter tumulisoli]
MPSDLAENQIVIRRAILHLCGQMGWSSLNELPLPDGRRADIMALRPDNGFVCIEIKSGPRDFLTDAKWPCYREWCDQLFFAVDRDFPVALLPDSVGLMIVATDMRPAGYGIIAESAIMREAPACPLPSARRRKLTHLFAMQAAGRLGRLDDPAITASLRAARRIE